MKRTILTKKVIEIGGSLYVNVPKPNAQEINLAEGDLVKAEIFIVQKHGSK